MALMSTIIIILGALGSEAEEDEDPKDEEVSMVTKVGILLTVIFSITAACFEGADLF